MVILILMSLFPAAFMALIGMMSFRPGRKSLLLFSLCLLWVALGGLMLFLACREGLFTWDQGIFAILCFGQAAAGMAGWIGAAVRQVNEATTPSPSTSGPPAP